MADATRLLQARIAGMPVWLVGLVLVGGGYLAYRMGIFGGRAAAPATPAAQPVASATPPPSSDGSAGAALQQELGLLQQLQQFQQTQQGPAPATPPPGPLAPTVTVRSGAPIWSNDCSRQGVIGRAPGGPLPSLGTGPGCVGNVPGHLVQWAGQIGWVYGTDVIGASGPAPATAPGAGGAAVHIPPRHSLAAGRSSLGSVPSLWRSGHPLLRSADPLHAHYALGGPPSAVHVVAAHINTHPGRLLAVNPHLVAGQARGRQYIRVR